MYSKLNNVYVCNGKNSKGQNRDYVYVTVQERQLTDHSASVSHDTEQSGEDTSNNNNNEDSNKTLDKDDDGVNIASDSAENQPGGTTVLECQEGEEC